MRDSPGVFWIYDRPTEQGTKRDKFCVLHDIRGRHSCMIIPSIQTPAGTVQRTIWTLWTTSDEIVDDGRTSCTLEASMMGAGVSDRLFSIRKITDARERAHTADVAHYTSMGGILDVLDDEKMSSTVSSSDRRLIHALHATSIMAALKVLTSSQDVTLKPLQPIAAAHRRMLARENVDVRPIELFRQQLCGIVNRVCVSTLRVQTASFMFDTYATLEQMGISSLVATHLSKASCYVSSDMSGTDVRQARLIQSYKQLCEELATEDERLPLVAGVARVLLTAAACHGGRVHKGLGLYGAVIKRADELSACAICAKRLWKFDIAAGKAHLCPHSSESTYIVCEGCGGDMACSRCTDAHSAIDFSDLAIEAVCENVSLSLRMQAWADKPPRNGSVEAELRRELHEVKATLYGMRADAKRSRRKSRSAASVTADVEVQTEGPKPGELMARDVSSFARAWLDRARRRMLSAALDRGRADATRLSELEARLDRYSTMCASLRSTMDASGLVYGPHPANP